MKSIFITMALLSCLAVSIHTSAQTTNATLGGTVSDSSLAGRLLRREQQMAEGAEYFAGVDILFEYRERGPHRLQKHKAIQQLAMVGRKAISG